MDIHTYFRVKRKLPQFLLTSSNFFYYGKQPFYAGGFSGGQLPVAAFFNASQFTKHSTFYLFCGGLL